MMKHLIVVFLFFAHLFTTLNAQEQSLEKVSLQLQWKHQFQFAGFYIAKERGYYKEAGLDVHIKEYDRTVNIVDDVINNKSTFGTNYPTLILDKSQGKDVVLLSAILQSSPHAMVSLASSNINSIKDFKNKTIMINQNAASAAPFVSMLQSNQLTFNDMKVVPHSFNINDLIDGKVDVTTIFKSNEPFKLNEKKIKYKIWDPKDYGFDFYDVLLFTSNQHVKNKPDMVKSFNEASLKGWRYAFENIEETVDLILEKYNSQNKSKKALIYEADELRKLAFYQTKELGNIDPNSIQRIYDIYNVLGLTKDKLNVREFILNQRNTQYTTKEKLYLTQNSFNIYVNNWLPFASYNTENKEFQGLAIDYWKKIAQHAQIDNTIHYTDSFLALLNKSKNDPRAVTLSLSYTEERAKTGTFTKPYVEFPVAIATSLKEEYIVDFEYLAGKTVAVGKNFSAHKLLKQHYPNIQFVPVKNTAEALSLLAQKKVYAAADILPTLSYYLNKYAYANLKISGTSEFKFEVRMMVNKEHADLVPILNKAIDAMSDDEKKLINNKWLQYSKPIETVDYVLLSMILVPLAMIILFVLILYYNQKKYIKELKQKEKLIKSQTIELEKGQEVLSQYVLFSRTNKKGIITDVSKAFCTLSGYSKDELLGQPHNIVRHLDMKPEVFEEMWTTIQSGKTWKGEIKNRTKEGQEYWIDTNISPEFDNHNNVIGYVSIKINITAKKEFEKQHLQLIEKAKMASLGEMIGNIAHQWRQPLNLITVATSGIQLHHQLKTLDNEMMKEHTDSILQQARYLSNTIDTFKNFIKKENAEQKILLQSEIQHAVDIIQTVLKNNFIDLQSNLDHTEDINIYMRKGELTQVIINILNNAKDALTQRDIKNPVIKLTMKKSKDVVTISIEDNAGGIDKKILPHIFEPYYTTKHQSQGTGLGLYMSYQMITESLHGKLTVKNSTEGALFTITVPYHLEIQ